MPELPEVTTIVSGLNKKVKNLIIKDVWTDWAKIIKSQTFEQFKNGVVDRKILNSERVGKNILMHLSGGKTILLHMKMTGHLLYGKWIKNDGIWKSEEKGPLSDPYNRFLHLIFFLSNGKQLALSDVRKFGKVVLLNEGEEFNSADLKNVGPDPLSEGFNLKKFKEVLSKKKDGAIKQILMDQQIVSGIGNIYSDEILWAVGIHPQERLNKISEDKIAEIFKATKKILNSSIKLGGDSMSDFRNIDGEKGNYQNNHFAYRQTGKPCSKKDGGKIVRIKTGGRSAHFCDMHQQVSQ